MMVDTDSPTDDEDAQELARLLALDAPTDDELMAIAYLSMSPAMRAWLRARVDRSTPFVSLLRRRSSRV